MKYIALILLILMMVNAASASADETRVAAISTQQQTAADPAQMDDAALASYITGRLKQALKTDDDKVDQYCDALGCTVVVQ